jgi:hypothetical protein
MSNRIYGVVLLVCGLAAGTQAIAQDETYIRAGQR